ncbi:hypothetical protein J6590_004341 [Homalodisca vitripennis]|nr:hypothetical protein J6590_004341 [Homalodisca vitripennis]
MELQPMLTNFISSTCIISTNIPIPQQLAFETADHARLKHREKNSYKPTTLIGKKRTTAVMVREEGPKYPLAPCRCECDGTKLLRLN